MADIAVSIALRTLNQLLLKQGGSLSDVRHKVEALETQLIEMKSLLIDAGKRRSQSESVANWIAEITELACRAEDVIDEHVYSRSRETFYTSFIRRPRCSAEISRITREMERIGRRMKQSGFLICDDTSNPDPNLHWTRTTFHIDTVDCFVGKEEDLNFLISLLTGQRRDHHVPVVVSLWGMGGIGKTTVAKKVYNHAAVKRNFDCCAWVCITQQCEIRTVFEEVLTQLNPRENDDKISSLSNAQLIQRLLSVQQAKRCFIVLDDLWEMEQWRGLKSGLLVEGLTTTRILLTTRKEKVADVGFPHKLGLLNSDDAWELLKKKALPHIHIQDFLSQEKLFEKMGKEMVRKCGHLPLVVSILGGILSKRKSIGEWELVNQKIADYLYSADNIENETEFHEVLSLSYYDLPYYLKPCFLYMGLIKEDQTVYVEDLYWLWIAQGMISLDNQGSERSLMDIAELYLSELASRCIVQVEYGDGNKITSCKLHDVVRQLCLRMGEVEGFGLQNLTYQGGQFSTLLHGDGTKNKRHLIIHLERDVESQSRNKITHREDTRSKHLRSLQLLHYTTRDNQIELPRTIIDFQKFKLLRVLVFLSIKFSDRKLPPGIGDLIHLRCLRIRKCEFDELPKSIGNLIYLQTLDLKHSWNVRVPDVFNKLLELKHLLLPSYEPDVIADHYRLRLDEGLDELETLMGFNSSIHQLESITRLKNLRRFSAAVMDNESLSAIINAINTQWERLELSVVRVHKGCDLASTEQGVIMVNNMLACPTLTALGLGVPIRNRIMELENERIIGSKLTTLSMWLTEVETMEILGKLPLLENLNLLENSFVGEEMTCRASDFPRLKKLWLMNLPNLREWSVEVGGMPLVSEIEIDGCPRLEMIPDGFRSISTLEKLIIVRMPELGQRVLAIKEDGGGEGEDFNKIRHVPSIITYLD